MKKIISIIIIAAFLLNTILVDLGWARESMNRIRPAEDVKTSVAVEEALWTNTKTDVGANNHSPFVGAAFMAAQDIVGTPLVGAQNTNVGAKNFSPLHSEISRTSPAFTNEQNFANQYTVTWPERGKSVSRTVGEIIKTAIPACVFTLEMLTEINALMAKSDFAQKPTIVWQIDRLGRMYPFFAPELMEIMGIVRVDAMQLRDFVMLDMPIPDEIKNARYILLNNRLASTEEADGSIIPRTIRSFSETLGAPVIAVDFSEHLFSGAQNHIAIREGKEGRKAIAINAISGIDVARLREKFLQIDPFFILLNANPVPSKTRLGGIPSLFDNRSLFLERLPDKTVIITDEGRQPQCFYDVFGRVYGNATIEAAYASGLFIKKGDSLTFVDVSEDASLADRTSPATIDRKLPTPCPITENLGETVKGERSILGAV